MISKCLDQICRSEEMFSGLHIFLCVWKYLKKEKMIWIGGKNGA